jgi:hypothetical protein
VDLRRRAYNEECCFVLVSFVDDVLDPQTLPRNRSWLSHYPRA